jgi:tetratricopeptide (TPR) repeat protein
MSEHASMNRKQRRRASKLGQIPSPPSVKTATSVVPRDDTSLLALGAKHHQAGRLADHQAIRIKPDSAETHCNLGNALRGQGKFDEAVAACGQASRIKPDSSEAPSSRNHQYQKSAQTRVYYPKPEI